MPMFKLNVYLPDCKRTIYQSAEDGFTAINNLRASIGCPRATISATCIKQDLTQLDYEKRGERKEELRAGFDK